MSTTYAPRAHVHRPHLGPWLLVTVLAAALVGLGAWVLVDRTTGGGGATQDATTLIDDFIAATNSHDARAATALLAPGFVMWSTGTTVAGAKEMASQIAGTPTLHVERKGPVSVAGEFTSTFTRFTVSGLGIDMPMLQVVQIRDGKIYRLWQFALGTTAPFANTRVPTF